MALTSTNRPLPPVRTCRFLVPGQSGTGRFYGRCALGTPEQRLAWLANLDQERLERLRNVRQRLAVAVEPETKALWEAKGRQLNAYRDRAAVAAATAAVRVAADRVMSAVDRFLSEHRETVTSAGLPIDATRELVQALLDDLVVTRSVQTDRFTASPEVLARFPPEVRALFGAYDAAQRPTVDSGRSV